MFLFKLDESSNDQYDIPKWVRLNYEIILPFIYYVEEGIMPKIDDIVTWGVADFITHDVSSNRLDLITQPDKNHAILIVQLQITKCAMITGVS